MSHAVAIGLFGTEMMIDEASTCLERAGWAALDPESGPSAVIMAELAECAFRLRPDFCWFTRLREGDVDLDAIYCLSEEVATGALREFVEAAGKHEIIDAVGVLVYDLSDDRVQKRPPSSLHELVAEIVRAYEGGGPLGSVFHEFMRSVGMSLRTSTGPELPGVHCRHLGPECIQPHLEVNPIPTGLLVDLLTRRFGVPQRPIEDSTRWVWSGDRDCNSFLIMRRPASRRALRLGGPLAEIYGDALGGSLIGGSISVSLLADLEVRGLATRRYLLEQPEVTRARGLDPEIEYFMNAAMVWFYGVKNHQLYCYDGETDELYSRGAVDVALDELIEEWVQAGKP